MEHLSHCASHCHCSWVGYEKEGYRGNQYLLEEGEYQDWRVWGGCNSELRSARVIRAVRCHKVTVWIILNVHFRRKAWLRL